MKLPKNFALYMIVLVLLAVPLAAQYAPAKAATGFDQLKSLDGEWEGKSVSGQPVRIVVVPKIASPGCLLVLSHAVSLIV